MSGYDGIPDCGCRNTAHDPTCSLGNVTVILPSPDFARLPPPNPPNDYRLALERAYRAGWERYREQIAGGPSHWGDAEEGAAAAWADVWMTAPAGPAGKETL